MRWSLATQLRLGFGAALLMTLGVVAGAWWGALNYGNEINHAYETQLRTTVQLAEAQSAFLQLRFGLRQFMIDTPEGQQRILKGQDKWYAIVEERLAAYDKAAGSIEERRALTSLRSAYQRYKQVRPKFFELWQAREKDDAIAWLELVVAPFGAEATREFGAQIALQQSFVNQDRDQSDRKVYSALVLVTAITIVLLGMLVIGYLQAIRMLRPIRALRDEVQHLVREQLAETIDAAPGGNEVTALVEGFQLMSDRLRAHVESLRQSHDRLEFLLGATPAVIWTSRIGGLFERTFISANVRAVLGHEPENFFRDSGFWSRNIHPEDRERILAGLATIEHEGSRVHEYRFRHKDGSWRWMHAEASVIRDASGAARELAGYWIDVTARKKAEDALRESAARYERAVNGANDGIWEWTPSTGANYLSPRLKQLLGYEDHELPNVQEIFFDRLHPEDQPRVSEAIRAHLEERKHYAIALRLRCKSGEYRWFSSRGQAEWDQHGQPLRMAGSITDITERKRAEVAVMEALRAKSEFMNNITHELRTPLNSVIGFAGLLRDGVPGPLNAKQAQFAADILASGERLLALVEGILQMSRLDAAGAALERAPLEIGAALEERVAAHRKAAEARRVSITLDAAADAGSAELDPQALRRMLDALIDNAIKFSRDGGRVAVSARRAGGTLEIAVTDTGIGIAREDLGKLFKPLVQLDAGVARRHGGIGLGLALARRLAELHGGTIEVESEPGKGSTFTLRLPIQEKKQ